MIDSACRTRCSETAPRCGSPISPSPWAFRSKTGYMIGMVNYLICNLTLCWISWAQAVFKQNSQVVPAFAFICDPPGGGGKAAQLPPRGHALEVRIYAEDPAQDFRPTPGTARVVKWPTGHGIRVETGTVVSLPDPVLRVSRSVRSATESMTFVPSPSRLKFRLRRVKETEETFHLFSHRGSRFI